MRSEMHDSILFIRQKRAQHFCVSRFLVILWSGLGVYIQHLYSTDTVDATRAASLMLRGTLRKRRIHSLLLQLSKRVEKYAPSEARTHDLRIRVCQAVHPVILSYETYALPAEPWKLIRSYVIKYMIVCSESESV